MLRIYLLEFIVKKNLTFYLHSFITCETIMTWEEWLIQHFPGFLRRWEQGGLPLVRCQWWFFVWLACHVSRRWKTSAGVAVLTASWTPRVSIVRWNLKEGAGKATGLYRERHLWMDEGALQAEIQHCTESKDANGTGYMRYGTYPVRSHRCRGCNIA